MRYASEAGCSPHYLLNYGLCYLVRLYAAKFNADGVPKLSETWISVEQIAEHLGVTQDSIYRWIDAKGLPAHKIGRLWKFKVSEVDGWVRREGARDDDVRKRDGH